MIIFELISSLENEPYAPDVDKNCVDEAEEAGVYAHHGDAFAYGNETDADLHFYDVGCGQQGAGCSDAFGRAVGAADEVDFGAFGWLQQVLFLVGSWLGYYCFGLDEWFVVVTLHLLVGIGALVPLYC